MANSTIERLLEDRAKKRLAEDMNRKFEPFIQSLGNSRYTSIKLPNGAQYAEGVQIEYLMRQIQDQLRAAHLSAYIEAEAKLLLAAIDREGGK